MSLLLSRPLRSVLIFLSLLVLNTQMYAIPDATSRCFIQNAKSGSCKRIKKSPDQYLVTFKDVAPNWCNAVSLKLHLIAHF